MLYYSLLGYQIFSSIWHQVAVTAFILTYPIFSPVNHHQERKRAHGDFEASCTSSLGGNFVKYMHVVFRHLWQKICMASFLVMGPILISLLLCWDACQQVRTGYPLIHAVESHTWTPKKNLAGMYIISIDQIVICAGSWSPWEWQEETYKGEERRCCSRGSTRVVIAHNQSAELQLQIAGTIP